MTRIIKSVTQRFVPTTQVLELMERFRQMVNHCLKIGLENDVSTLNKLSNLSYSTLAKYDVITYYKLCSITHSVGILANRKKSLKRGWNPRIPYAKRSLLISCCGFKIVNSVLKVPVHSKGRGFNDMIYFDIDLSKHAKEILSDPSLKVHSFTLTSNNTVSICYSKEVAEIECTKAVGVDRNLDNLTVGDNGNITKYDLSKSINIAENTRSIISSFKRNDVKIRRKIAGKYGKRRKNRINQLLHQVSKQVINEAKENKTAIAFERLTYIRRLYQKGNYRGSNYRYKLNAWPFAEMKRQIEYKAKWEGLPVIQLSVSETRGTSQLCPQCGKKMTQVDRKFREIWFAECKRWMDRDVVAAMNISIRGLQRFCSSKGLASEAMKGNPTTPVILRVDASKLASKRKPRSYRNLRVDFRI